MQSANAKPTNGAKRKAAMSKADALEMLSSFLADLVRAGVQVDYTCEGGVLNITVQGVEEARDDEGVYFKPVEPTSEPVAALTKAQPA